MQHLPGTSRVVPALSTCRCLYSLVAPPYLSQCSYLPVTYHFSMISLGHGTRGESKKAFLQLDVSMTVIL